MKPSKTITFLFSSLVGMTGANAYEVVTHQQLTAEAVERSALVLDPTLFTDIDMPGIDYNYPSARDTVPFPGRTVVGFGAADEDGNSSDDQRRVFNHFYDVQYNNYAGRGMDIVILPQLWRYTGNPSPLWATEDAGNVSDLANDFPQVFSVRQLQQYYYGSLTAAARQDRIRYFGRVLESSGHVVHHLQDMAQPQHVRNDQHLHPLPIPYTNINPGWALYEQYSWRKFEKPGVLSGLLSAYPYPPPTFGTSREFWYTTGTSVPRYLGMGEFTSNNFVSHGTNFRPTWLTASSVNIQPSFTQPLPNKFNYDGTSKYLETQNVTVSMMDGSQRSGNVDFVIGKSYDEKFGGITGNLRVASVSVTDMAAYGSQYGANSGRSNVFSENTAIFDDEHRVLIPRTVAFSAGLINHMFRGRLGLVRSNPTSHSWTVTNLSRTMVNGSAVGQSIVGRVALYYEDSNGTRTPMPGAGSKSVDLAYGVSVDIGDTEPPSSTQKVIAVFWGKIGAEGDSLADPATGFYAVAGKVISYTGAQIPCSTNPAATGWVYLNLLGDGKGINNGGTENPGLMELGSTPGKVYGDFNARWAPNATRWSFTIRRGGSSGSVLYSSGYFFGYKAFSFDFPGGLNGTEHKVFIRVAPEISPNVTDSNIWGIQVGCPGVPLNDENRGMPQQDIQLWFWGPPGYCQTGTIDLVLDGTTYSVPAPWGGGQGQYSSVNAKVIGGTHYLSGKTKTTSTFGCGGSSPIKFGYTLNGVKHNFLPNGDSFTIPGGLQ